MPDKFVRNISYLPMVLWIIPKWALRRKGARIIPDAKSPSRCTLLPVQDDWVQTLRFSSHAVERILDASRYLHDVSRES